MNFKERYRFVRGLRTAATNPIYKEEYRRLCKLHSRIPSTFLHHMPQIFLPWHRWYLLEFENFLRQIDCRITIPYLDWSKDLDNWARGTKKSDVWNPIRRWRSVAWWLRHGWAIQRRDLLYTRNDRLRMFEKKFQSLMLSSKQRPNRKRYKQFQFYCVWKVHSR